MKNKAPMREAIFYRLYKRLKENNHTYMPVYELIGEVFIREVSMWAFVSYEVSARCSAMMKENPSLLQREKMRGKSGAKYYGYRLNPNAQVEFIKDPGLRTFYLKVNHIMSLMKNV